MPRGIEEPEFFFDEISDQAARMFERSIEAPDGEPVKPERVDQKIGELKWPDQRCRRMNVHGLPQKSIERTLMSPTDLCCPAGVDKFDAVPDIENDPIDVTYKRSESG